MTLVLMQCNGTVSNVHEVYLLTVNMNVFHRSTVMDCSGECCWWACKRFSALDCALCVSVGSKAHLSVYRCSEV